MLAVTSQCTPDMRLVFLFFALIFVAAGILFGALNPQPARVDFYWFAFEGSLGALLLIFALIGAGFGGAALLVGVVWPLQGRLRRERRAHAHPARAEPAPSADVPLALGSDRP